MKKPHLFLFAILAICSCSPSGTPLASKSIGILAFGKQDTALLQAISREIRDFYSCRVYLLGQSDLPGSSFLTERKRYRADSLIGYLRRIKPDSISHIIGITSEDISVPLRGHSDWGVFGLGYCPGPAAVVSTFRLKKKAGNEKQFITRLRNVTLHELGHNFGLPHCTDSSCLMRDAHGKISSIEGRDRTFCPSCQSECHETI